MHVVTPSPWLYLLAERSQLLAIPHTGTVTGMLLYSGWMAFIVTGVQSCPPITIETLKSVFRH